MDNAGKIIKPRILLTCGDPNGIGTEIILKILNDKKFTDRFCLSAVGPGIVFNHYEQLLKIRPTYELIDVDTSKKFSVRPGTKDKYAGKIAGDCIRIAAELCFAGYYDAMVTLPISKETLNEGGYRYQGHTEMLGDITNSKDMLMIMHSQKFSVALLTNHIPVKKVAGSITKELIEKKVSNVYNSLKKDFLIKEPNIAMLSLNPHCGDGGIIGDEEIRIFAPALKRLRAKKILIDGPFPPDAYFGQGIYKKYDMTVASYHDQGLIPFKLLCQGSGVNYTAGLKIVRTSPDHGTAFDIAGKGIASTESTKEAIKLAEKIISAKKTNKRA